MKLIKYPIYFFIALGLIFVFFNRFKDLKNVEGKKLNSFPTELTKHGRPVEVLGLKRSDLRLFKKLSGTVINKEILEAKVGLALAKQVKIGQIVRLNSYATKNVGKVSWVSQEASLDDGLYKIKIKLPKKNRWPYKTLIPLRINTKTVRNVISIPPLSIANHKGHFYVWVVKNGVAKKVQIEIGAFNQKAIEVKKGLGPNTQLIINGHRNISEGDKVNILSIE